MSRSQITVRATARTWMTGLSVQPMHWLMRASVITLLLLGSVAMLAPIVWTISTSLRLPAASFSMPPRWIPTDLYWQNYQEVFSRVPFATFIVNSLKVSLAIVLGQLVTASMAGYAFARLRFPGKNVLFILLMAALMVPLQATIIPVFILIRLFGLADSHWALIIPAWATPFGVFLMRQTFMTVPDELVDAAKIDGASQWQIFSRVFIPLSLGPLAVLAILSFNSHWNEFFRPLIFLSTHDNYTVPLGLRVLQGYMMTGSISVVLAAVVLSMLPVLLIFVFAQRYVIEGIARTGVKG